MNKAEELARIAREIEDCRVCKIDKIGIAVPGEGNPDADIVFIGEAPGKKEAITGRPFIGRSGNLLRSLIKKVGLEEANVYITSPVKYLPKCGTPTEADIIHGRIHLEKQLAIIAPSIIVLMGAVASKAVLNQTILIKKKHGEILVKEGKNFFITFHPAAILRFPKLKTYIFDDFQKLAVLIKQ